MGQQLRQWRDDQKHLPEFMRDFHNCKDLFRGISEYIIFEEDNPASRVSWVQAHCYTIDVFLWFMAEHGYTLQRSRSRQNFTDLDERLTHLTDLRKKASAMVLTQALAQQVKP